MSEAAFVLILLFTAPGAPQPTNGLSVPFGNKDQCETARATYLRVPGVLANCHVSMLHYTPPNPH